MRQIKLVSEMNEEAIRSVNDYSVDVTGLFESLKKVSDKIESLYVVVADELKLVNNGETVKFASGVLSSVDSLLA